MLYVRAFLPEEEFTEEKSRELDKDFLGEMTNVLASKIAQYLTNSRMLRVTMPSIVFGKNLLDMAPKYAVILIVAIWK
ncbi:MAG: hypothetical protein EHM28_00195 [Spirochaetaceae bacterium]|nr:MAG: hypothetical protein EHM28_00195 [Spirochaetaceae bacterium]